MVIFLWEWFLCPVIEYHFTSRVVDLHQTLLEAAMAERESLKEHTKSL